MFKKLFGEDVLIDVWKKVLAWIVVGLLGLAIAFVASDRFAVLVTWAIATPINLTMPSGAFIGAGLTLAVLVFVVWRQRKRLLATRFGVPEIYAHLCSNTASIKAVQLLESE